MNQPRIALESQQETDANDFSDYYVINIHL